MSMLITLPTTKWDLLIVNRLEPILILLGEFSPFRQILRDVHIKIDTCIRGVPHFFVCSDALTNTPRVFPMSVWISSFQYYEGNEYRQSQIGAIVRFSLSGLKRSFHGRKYNPAELKKYSPLSKMRVRSTSLKKIIVKNFLAPS